MAVLALETSTSSAKAMVCDERGNVLVTRAERFPPGLSRDGVSDTEGLFRLTAKVGREAAQGRRIDAVGLCGVWHSVALCDGGMRPAEGTFAWNYRAPAEACREARRDEALSGELYRRTGCMPHVTYARDALRYLGGQGIPLKRRLLPTQAGYHFYRLTGEFLETRNIMSGTGLVSLEGPEYDAMALDYAGVGKNQLGALCDWRETRPLNAEGAALLGLKPGIPVVPAHSDGALNQLACGDAATLSVGTSGAVRMPSRKPALPEGGGLWCYRGVEGYVVGAAAASACNAVDWFRNVLIGGMMDADALDAAETDYDRLPVCLPFVFGERNPGWADDRLGLFSGISPEHTLADLYRSLQAGVLFNLYQCYELMLGELPPPKAIALSGGILNSRRWTQIAADIFGRELALAGNRDASTLGAATLALRAIGVDGQGAPAGLECAGAVRPDAEGAAKLAAAYRRYRSAYSRG